MKRLMILFVICMLAIIARVERMNLLQQRQDAIEQLYMLRSAEIVLGVPLAGNATWKDMLERK